MDVSFYDLPFKTAPGAVFTPRPTTERLVDAALAHLGPGPARIADVGTGAAAVAVSIALHRPGVEVFATDANPAAVVLARENAVRHGVADRVHVRHGDLLEGVPGPLDLVVANLPYLPPHRAADFPDEPTDAIVSSGDGFDHYRRLIAQATPLLRPGAPLLVQLHGEVRDLVPALAAA
jgi:release factor glutamine methyltransferase